MTRTLLAAGAAMILGLPLAAHAQPDAMGAPPPAGAVREHGDYTLKQREDWLSNRIDKAKDDGAIDGHEADRVRRELDRIKHDEDHYRDHHGGDQLTDNETADLEARLDQLADQIHWLHENSFRRPW
ncbi:MAG: hypothetical protein WA840_22680 [Caulobacteraceae bacterium]